MSEPSILRPSDINDARSRIMSRKIDTDCFWTFSCDRQQHSHHSAKRGGSHLPLSPTTSPLSLSKAVSAKPGGRGESLSIALSPTYVGRRRLQQGEQKNSPTLPRAGSGGSFAGSSDFRWTISNCRGLNQRATGQLLSQLIANDRRRDAYSHRPAPGRI